MTMYTPRAFVETDLARLDALIAEVPVVALLTTGGETAPAGDAGLMQAGDP